MVAGVASPSTASTWNSASVCPGRIASCRGRLRLALDDESCTYFALELVPGISVSLQTPLVPPVRVPGLHLIAPKLPVSGEVVPDAVIVRMTLLLKPA